MRAYTLSVLQKLAGSSKPISDAEIVEWVNTSLAAGGKTTSISSFKDPSIANSLPVLDLVDTIKPGSINYELVNKGTGEEVRGVSCRCGQKGTGEEVIVHLPYH